MPAHREELEKRFVQAMSFDDGEQDDEQQRGEDFGDDEGYTGSDQDEDEEGQQYEGRPLSRSASAASGSTASFDREFDDGPMPYSESAAIQSKKYMDRDQVKLALEQEERSRRLNKIRARRQHLDKWNQKLAKSPFHVNLVAENERLDEEHRLRMMERARRSRELDRRAKEAKSEVILKALTETPDLELLRREKRAIIDEEKRLKALLDLEKTNSHRKMDLLAARNAEKRRRQEKDEYRRRLRQQELQERDQTYKQLLKEKHALDGN
ncbi:hypothetical protein BBO99_00002682 [Phytophthora kernoviae]|uniref:Uncharacterized protein n=2 Tax=Phytophthora kernoviae TaxID=325452 RepID=A0A421GW45_9STRA|nr:hypothetical protein G195_003829 [Phytophthora kernoviae 00238/432]KAG2527970.1 hypothetical protein JM16_002407 [Phytophthora kernoviae]KAG2529363.1 hypothetical protein JM18_002814 [Phytophthora kernoviae]RLN36648.1 hypothetical protein BBI17_002679 [Phytophthora kernoviae]RLN82705.1 hypothetical protein BBO99_00002682 [Phytophthora kernoviae]